MVLRRDPDGVRVLMGRRSHAHAFMPGAVVFSGRRVDRADRHGPAHDDLHPAVLQKLAAATPRPTPARVRALAFTAIRETFEELASWSDQERKQLLGTAAGHGPRS